MAISWDYEEEECSYYQIYAIGGPLDGVLEVMTLSVPRTREYDREVQAVVDALKTIEARMKEEQLHEQQNH